MEEFIQGKKISKDYAQISGQNKKLGSLEGMPWHPSNVRH